MSRYGRDPKPEKDRVPSDGKVGGGGDKTEDRQDHGVRELWEEETARGISRRPVHTDARRERQEMRAKVRSAAYEIDNIEQWRQYMREELGLEEGTPQFEAAEKAWMELKRKQYGG